jgi:hypothetical protein
MVLRMRKRSLQMMHVAELWIRKRIPSVSKETGVFPAQKSCMVARAMQDLTDVMPSLRKEQIHENIRCTAPLINGKLRPRRIAI